MRGEEGKKSVPRIAAEGARRGRWRGGGRAEARRVESGESSLAGKAAHRRDALLACPGAAWTARLSAAVFHLAYWCCDS